MEENKQTYKQTNSIKTVKGGEEKEKNRMRKGRASENIISFAD